VRPRRGQRLAAEDFGRRPSLAGTTAKRAKPSETKARLTRCERACRGTAARSQRRTSALELRAGCSTLLPGGLGAMYAARPAEARAACLGRYDPCGASKDGAMIRRLVQGTLAASILALVAGSVPAWAGMDEAKAFYAEKCKVCHSIGGDAGKMAATGGPLDGVGAKRDAEWLRAYLTDPKSKMPNAKMPKIKMTDQQLQDQVDYMLSLKGPAK
jgi:mono/diheme cytochrome c family protein